MMLDIDGVLTRHHADTTDVLAAAQALATSAIGDLTNKMVNGQSSARALLACYQRDARMVNDRTEALHRAADAIAEQIRTALHKRIDEGKLPDW